VAASDTDMFMDILMTNRNAILDQLDVFSDRVKEIRSALEDNDEEELSRILLASQQRRSTWNAQRSV
jgi:prephenate dehydrogenase